MARRGKTKRKDVEQEPLVNAFAANHGKYMRESDDSDKAGKSTTMRNRHVSPVETWKALGKISETQARGIAYCEALWEKAHTSSPVVADYMRIPGMPGGDGWSQQEALDDLADLKGKTPATYWGVFENVCRFDEPGGTAGSRWANDIGRASTAALMCVRMVADLVAMWRRL